MIRHDLDLHSYSAATIAHALLALPARRQRAIVFALRQQITVGVAAMLQRAWLYGPDAAGSAVGLTVAQLLRRAMHQRSEDDHDD